MKKDIEIVRNFMQSKNISAYNTRLWKLSDNEFDLRKASAQVLPKETHQYNGNVTSIYFYLLFSENNK